MKLETLTLNNVSALFRLHARWVRVVATGEAFEIVRWVDDSTVEVRRASRPKDGGAE